MEWKIEIIWIIKMKKKIETNCKWNNNENNNEMKNKNDKK